MLNSQDFELKTTGKYVLQLANTNTQPPILLQKLNTMANTKLTIQLWFIITKDLIAPAVSTICLLQIDCNVVITIKVMTEILG